MEELIKFYDGRSPEAGYFAADTLKKKYKDIIPSGRIDSLYAQHHASYMRLYSAKSAVLPFSATDRDFIRFLEREIRDKGTFDSTEITEVLEMIIGRYKSVMSMDRMSDLLWYFEMELRHASKYCEFLR